MTSSNESQTFGRYEVESLLGRGAVGEVYLAGDPALSRKVAIKVLSSVDGLPAAEQEETRVRFLREARNAAALNHPNIVTIYDVGEQDGHPYIAMEYLRGVSLDRHTKEGHLLPVQKVLEIGIHAALALDEAHRAAIIHRDIKPANLVLLEDGTLKVADFGLAKDVRTSLTATQTLLGTPNYMAPEQIAGRTIDGRADLFSLAVSLYELLTGQRPFSGDTISSVLYRIVNDPPMPIGELRDDLPGALEHFFTSALAKDADSRPRGGNEFAQQLHAILASMGGVPSNLKIPPPSAIDGPTSSQLRREEPEEEERRRKGRGATLMRSLLLVIVLLALVAGAWTMPAWLGQDPLGKTRRPVEDWLSARLGGFGDAIRLTAPERLVPVFTNPGQLALRVVSDGILLDETGQLHLPGDRKEAIVIEVADPCYEGSRTLAPEEIGASISLEAKPRMVSVPVDSNPSKARITLDTRRLDQRTPTELPLQLCQSHVLLFSVKGRVPRELSLEAAQTREPWVKALEVVSLDPPPLGTLVVSAGRSFPVAVYDRRGRRLGKAGEKLRLTPGTHRLVLASSKVLYRKEISVQVVSGDQHTENVAYPALGSLNVFSIPADARVLATPGGGGKAREIGRTPLKGFPVVAGELEVVVEHPGGQGSHREVVRVRGGAKSTDLRVGMGGWQ